VYGRIGKITCQPGQRELLVSALLQGTQDMPGCRSYVVATDPEDENGVWVTEVWDTPEQHRASLQLPSVQQAIATARPVITGFAHSFETTPVGGVGL
jgi:quinol monooxygenase YgiN